MTTIHDAWEWYAKNRRLLLLIGRLGRKYWEAMPWDILEKDEKFKNVEGVDVHTDADAVLAEFDDLGIFVIFSIFEASLRNFVRAAVDQERSGIRHEALKRAAKRLLQNVEEGSFYTNVLDLYKDVDHNRVEEVSQIRRYRNWVAHGRQEGKKPSSISPKDAYDRLQAFLNVIGYLPPPTVLSVAAPVP